MSEPLRNPDFVLREGEIQEDVQKMELEKSKPPTTSESGRGEDQKGRQEKYVNDCVDEEFWRRMGRKGAPDTYPDSAMRTTLTRPGAKASDAGTGR